MIEEAIRFVLVDDAAVEALVASRVYPIVLPQAPTYPAVTYQLVSGVSHYSHDGSSNLASSRVQVDCWGATYAQVAALRDAVIAALSGFRGEVGGSPTLGSIYGAFREMERDEFGEELARTGDAPWRKTVDFIIWHEEP